jgi:hypothetical protein
VSDERCDERKNKMNLVKGEKSEQSSGKDTDGIKCGQRIHVVVFRPGGEVENQCFGRVIFD